MSGGKWGYLEFELDEMADTIISHALGDDPERDSMEYETRQQIENAAKVVRMMGRIEHELDWGFSADTCAACASIRVIEGLKAFFEGMYSLESGVVVLKSQAESLMCARCQEREQVRKTRKIKGE